MSAKWRIIHRQRNVIWTDKTSIGTKVFGEYKKWKFELSIMFHPDIEAKMSFSPRIADLWSNTFKFACLSIEPVAQKILSVFIVLCAHEMLL